MARAGGVTVFVEVKERTSQVHGAGYEAVTFSKRRRILQAARTYAASRGLEEAPLRFDVICVDWSSDGPRLRHYEDAFGEAG